MGLVFGGFPVRGCGPENRLLPRLPSEVIEQMRVKSVDRLGTNAGNPAGDEPCPGARPAPGFGYSGVLWKAT
jgi:hypothetical protein